MPGPAPLAQRSAPAVQPPARTASPEPSKAGAGDEAHASEESKPDLTATKVIAGAGAAATSAVLGSYLGAAGTVTGAALGSAVTVVGTSVYQHYLERTRESVRARIRLPSGRMVTVSEQIAVPPPRSADDGDAPPTQVLVTPVGGSAVEGSAGPASTATVAPVIAARRRRRRWVAAGVATVLAFLVGMLAITGVEWVKGSSISGDRSGTSVGRVIEGGGAPSNRTSTTPTTDQTPTDERNAPTTGPTQSATPTTPEDDGSTSTTEPGPTGSTREPGRTGSSSSSPQPTSASPFPTTPPGVGP